MSKGKDYGFEFREVHRIYQEGRWVATTDHVYWGLSPDEAHDAAVRDMRELYDMLDITRPFVFEAEMPDHPIRGLRIQRHGNDPRMMSDAIAGAPPTSDRTH